MTMQKGISAEEQGKTIDEIDFELGTWQDNETFQEKQDISQVPVEGKIFDYFFFN